MGDNKEGTDNELDTIFETKVWEDGWDVGRRHPTATA